MRTAPGRGLLRRARMAAVLLLGAMRALLGPSAAAATDAPPIYPGDAGPTYIVVPTPAVSAGPPAVGVLLPLSGRYQAFGESCLRGIRVGLGALEGKTPALRVVILDTRGEPAQAAAAYQKLAADPSIVAVLGPMISADVDAVATYAHGFDLPTFSFSPQPIAAGGPMFRFSLTKEDQASALARHAVGELGLRRIAMFHSDDSYGREISSYFRIAVEGMGGRVIADVDYPPGKNDLQAEAKRLAAKVGVKPDQPPAVDAIFIPETADRLGMLTSYLAFVDIRGVQLLGGSGWDRPQELLAAGPNVNGGAFVDGFFLYSFRPEVRAFVDQYRDAFHGDPGAVEAYGYDAASFVKSLVTGGATTRQALLAELRRPHVFEGATGETAIGAGGRLQKGMFVLRVEEGTVREVESGAGSARAGDEGGAIPAPASPWRRPDFDSRSVDDRIGH